MSAAPSRTEVADILKELSNIFDAVVAKHACAADQKDLAEEMQYAKDIVFGASMERLIGAPSSSSSSSADSGSFDTFCAAIAVKFPGIQTELAAVRGSDEEKRVQVMALVQARLAFEASLTEQLLASPGDSSTATVVAMSPIDGRIPKKISHLSTGLNDIVSTTRHLEGRLAELYDQTEETAVVASKFL